MIHEPEGNLPGKMKYLIERGMHPHGVCLKLADAVD
jgi:hypothetical protein